MDRVFAEIKEDMELRNMQSFTEWLAWYSEWAGLSWCSEGLPDDQRFVEEPELEMRSAVEFMRPELTIGQLKLLKVWDDRYAAWRAAGVFYRNYAIGSPCRCDWQREREDAAENLGRVIPFSHWWLWPPEPKE